MEAILLKQYDTGQGVRLQLADDGVPDNLTDAEVHMMFGNHTVVGTIEDPLQAQVLFSFNSEHLASATTYTFDIKVRHLDGREDTYPTEGYGVLVILKSKRMGA